MFYISEEYKTELDKMYSLFLHEFSEENKSKFHGRNIYIDFNDTINDKCSIFWHMASLDATKSFYNILPCNNTVYGKNCYKNCVKSNYHHVINNEDRNICLYRASKISLFNKVIELANNGDDHIKIWKEKKDSKEYELIRYQEEENDYLIVLRYVKNKDYYRLTTAYPVFFESKKEELDKKYFSYINAKK